MTTPEFETPRIFGWAFASWFSGERQPVLERLYRNVGGMNGAPGQPEGDIYDVFFPTSEGDNTNMRTLWGRDNHPPLSTGIWDNNVNHANLAIGTIGDAILSGYGPNNWYGITLLMGGTISNVQAEFNDYNSHLTGRLAYYSDRHDHRRPVPRSYTMALQDTFHESEDIAVLVVTDTHMYALSIGIPMHFWFAEDALILSSVRFTSDDEIQHRGTLRQKEIYWIGDGGFFTSLNVIV